MPLSKDPTAYSDVEAVFATALREGGGKYILPDSGAAVSWRLRAYTYRRILHEREDYRYAEFRLRLDGTGVIIEVAQPKGHFVSKSGQTIPITDEFQQEAEALLADLDKEESIV